MNLYHDALKDLTAHAEFKAEGGTFHRHFLLVKGHMVNDHRHVNIPRLEGLRMAMRVERMCSLALLFSH